MWDAKVFSIVLLIAFSLTACTANAATIALNNEKKAATSFTAARNNEVKSSLNADSIAAEAELATRGLIAEKKNLVIPKAGGQMNAWDMTKYDFLTGDAPDTVNPKLWEHAKLNMNIGLYRVSP